MKKSFVLILLSVLILIPFVNSCSSSDDESSDASAKITLSFSAIAKNTNDTVNSEDLDENSVVQLIDKTGNVIQEQAIPENRTVTFTDLEVGQKIAIRAQIDSLAGQSSFSTLKRGTNTINLSLNETNYFVDSLNGSDDNTGTSIKSPFKSLEKAWSTARPADAREDQQGNECAIALLSNVELSEALENGTNQGDLTLYLNGYTIYNKYTTSEATQTPSEGSIPALFTSTSKISMFNGTIDGNNLNTNAFFNTATLKLEDMLVKNFSGDYVIVLSRGELLLTDTIIRDSSVTQVPVYIASGHAELTSSKIYNTSGIVGAICNIGASTVLTDDTMIYNITSKGGDITNSNNNSTTTIDENIAVYNAGTVVMCGASIKSCVYNTGTFALLDSYTHQWTVDDKTYEGNSFSIGKNQQNLIKNAAENTGAAFSQTECARLILGPSAKFEAANGTPGVINQLYTSSGTPNNNGNIGLVSEDFKNDVVAYLLGQQITNEGETAGTPYTPFLSERDVDESTFQKFVDVAETTLKYFPLAKKADYADKYEYKYSEDYGKWQITVKQN